jgi:hypothetical protein
VPTRLQRFERGESLQVLPADMSRAQASADLVRALGSVRNLSAGVGQELAAQRGQAAGQAAGAGTEAPERRSGITPYGRSFNHAAQRAHAAAIDGDIRLNTARIAAEAPTDTAEFDARMEGYRRGLVEQIDPAMRPAVEQELELQTFRHRQKVQAAEEQLILQENMATLVTEAEGIQTDTLAAARDGDIDIVQHQSEKLRELIEAATQTRDNPDGLIEPQRAQEMIRSFERAIDSELVIGDFERILREGGSTAGQQAFDEFEGARIDGLGELTTEDRDRLVNRMQALLNRQIARENRDQAQGDAAERAWRQELKERTDRAVRILEQGFEPEGLDDLLEDARGTEFESEVRVAAAMAGTAHAFALRSPREQEVILNTIEADMRGRPVDELELDRLARLEKIHDNMQRELNNDALSYAMRQGIIEPVAPLNFADPEALAEGLRERAGAIARAQGHYRQPVPAFTEQEAAELTDALAAGTAGEQLQLLTGVVDALGSKAPAALEAVHKQGHDMMAFVGGMMVDGNPAARDVLIGRQHLAADSGLAPADMDARPELEAVRKAYPPGTQAAVVQAIEAHYARLSAVEGDHSGEFDTRRFRRSVEKVTGGIIEHTSGGMFSRTRSVFPAPERGMTSRDFRGWIRSLEPDDIERMGGVAGMSPQFVLDQLEGGAKLVPVGRGRWLVSLTSSVDGGERFLHAANPADPSAPEFVLEFFPDARPGRREDPEP